MMQLSKRMIVVSLLVPAILVGLLSLGMAVRQLQRDTAITAEILLGQVDHVTSIARHTLHTTAQMANQPCENVVEKMTETGALTPYIRSTGLVRGDTLVCSSITGSRQQSIRSVYGLPLSAEMGSLEITAINGTRSVPHQTAIIYASGAGNGITVFSVVDGRYFTDLMETLDDENHAILRLRFSDGPVISSQDKGTEDLAGFSAVFNSDFSQARIQIITPWQSLARYLVRNMIFLGPASLLLTLATLYLWRRWLTGKLSLADEIAKGMARGEFVVHYQPVCEAASGMCTGAEALMGDPNASLPTPQPVFYRPMFGAMGKTLQDTCATFVSQAALDDGVKEKAGLERQVIAINNCRSVTKRDLVRNSATPHIEVDPETFAVKVDGEHATCNPVTTAVMNQKYFFG